MISIFDIVFSAIRLTFFIGQKVSYQTVQRVKLVINHLQYCTFK